MSERNWHRNKAGAATFTCDCGEELTVWPPGSNVECEECGREFNSGGQLLVPRSQWGDEAGETSADYDRGFANPDRAFEEEP